MDRGARKRAICNPEAGDSHMHQENPYMLELAYHAYCRLALALSVLSSPKLSEHFAAVFNKIARDAKHKLSINKPD